MLIHLRRRLIRIESHRREHVGGVAFGLLRTHPPRPVDQRELVGVDIEVGKGRLGFWIGLRRSQQLPLRADRHVFPGAHRERPREQTCDAREEHGDRGHAGGSDTEHQSEIADQPVVGAEDRGAEASGQSSSAAGRESSQHLAVDPLVGGHRVCRVDVGVIRRAGLGPLRQGEHEERAEVAREEREEARAQVSLARCADIIAEQRQPMGLVPTLGLGEREKDLTLLAGLPFREVPVDGGFGALVGEVLPPPPDLLLA